MISLNKDSLNDFINSIPYMVLSALLIGLSVSLYIYAGFGSDSITIFEDGIHRTFNVSLGVASYIYAGFTLLLGFLLGRKYITIISIANSFLCGPFIDLFDIFFSKINSTSLIMRLTLLIFGIITTALSCAILIYKGSGTSSLDAIVLGISDKFKLEYKIVRTITDITLFVAGIFMNGQFGIGSIVATISTGTIINCLVKLFKKIK